jgi:hypothetical protein
MTLDRQAVANWSYRLAPVPALMLSLYLVRRGYSPGQMVLASTAVLLSIMLIGLLLQPPGAMRSLQWGIWAIAGIFAGIYWFFYK